MKDSRIGETLWSEWTGNYYPITSKSTIVFFTEEHVDVEHDVVKRALASTIQRGGHTDSLGQAFATLDSCSVEQGYVGIIDGDTEFSLCDINGMTIYEDTVEKVIPVTWVNINVR
jgi:hypothetical protein